jgi:hypothetical protein
VCKIRITKHDGVNGRWDAECVDERVARRYILNCAKVKFHRPQKLPHPRRDEVAKYDEQFLPDKDIAAKMGISVQAVRMLRWAGKKALKQETL